MLGRVGPHAMVGAHSLVDADIMPFCIAAGNRAKLSGIGVLIGLDRRGFDVDSVARLRALFRLLIRSEQKLFADQVSGGTAVIFR